ncbi:hypothetical protein ACF073_06825 [Streptomyces sp. NPDC015171]|uniref:hypothetical protein n=1 Tax=Streptomyces sp. NPDC015171 TaxID=3364945 RepID=UPI0037012C9E
MSGLTVPDGALAVDLAAHRNNVGCSTASEAAGEGFDGFGRFLPLEMLHGLAPALGLPPARGTGVADNVACEGQTVRLPRGGGAVAAVHAVGAGSGGSVREVFRLRQDRSGGARGTDLVIGFSDILARHPAPGERCCAEGEFFLDSGGEAVPGAVPRLWQVTVDCAGRSPSARLELPYNPDLHLFGLWVSYAEQREVAP